MGIFIVHEGESIPMHDHPNMHGIIKCLRGHLRISSLSRKVYFCKIIKQSIPNKKGTNRENKEYMIKILIKVI